MRREMGRDTLLRASGELLMPMCISIQLEDEEIDEVI